MCPHEECLRVAPKLRCAGKAQQSHWPGPGGSGTSTSREGLCSAEGAEIGGPSGDARLLLAVGAQRRTLRSPPQEQLPHPRLPGASTPLANTPPQAKRSLNSAAPATGLGQWGKLTAVATGHSAQPAGFSPRSPGGEAKKRTSQPRGAAATAWAKGARMGRLPRRGPCPGRWLAGRLPLAVRLGLTIRTPQTLPATRGVSPGVSLGRESEPAAAGAAEGGGLCTRGRELENAVRAGGRLASGLGLRSATTETPFLRLPEQSAPGRRARGYKWGGAAGRAGGRTRLPRVTPGEGGREEALESVPRWRRRRKRRGDGEERVGGVHREEARDGRCREWRQTKRTRYLSH
ncbi:uncharacterized protein LOC141570780 [Rhinolophus sinicus]|uniref:uncharacterized protein LOC141570780 n=1 Tax=Rhinolophus sinicus TaxID=89399 RepID=UPI003D79BE04